MAGRQLTLELGTVLLRGVCWRGRHHFSAFKNDYSKCVNSVNARQLAVVGRRWSSTTVDVVQQPRPLTCPSEDEEAMRSNLQRFAREKIQPFVKEMDQEGTLKPDIIEAMFEQGLMGIEVDPQYGGSGLPFFASIIAIEELARVDPVASLMVDVHNTLVNTMVTSLGTEQQKSLYLPRLATNTVGAFCLSEPHSGSDAFALKTSAEDQGDHFVLNGSKMWITNAGHTGIFLVMANADISKGFRGITTFIVEKEMEGVTVGKEESKLGLSASSTCPIHFDNVKVPQSNVLGEVGQGYRYAIETLNTGRIGIAAQTLGMAQGALDFTLPYLMERKQFGQKIWDFQAVQHQVAHLASQVEAARLLTYNSARLKEAGQPFIKQAAMAKYFASELAGQVTSKCIDLAGGVGFSKEFPLEKFYRDCKVGTIYEGTSNIQLNTIAKLIAREMKEN